MLLPALSKAREKARQAVCLNNLKQIGLAVQFYAQDYDEWLPAAREEGTTQRTWVTYILPYLLKSPTYGTAPITRVSYFDLYDGFHRTPVNVKNIFWCPSGPRERYTPYGTPTKLEDGPNYGYNGYCGFFNSTYGYPAYPYYSRKKLSRVKEPSKAFLITDVRAGPNETNIYRHLYPSSKTHVGEAISRRHTGGVNILFVDSHCEWRKWEQIPGSSQDSIFWMRYEF
ncbi:MAG: DUF1559 domain-containing protein [Candidatus Omnitrophica bacterium]|nr:DUF1559 domain-containing protein [Candidatus Omnitrophota bacterium]